MPLYLSIELIFRHTLGNYSPGSQDDCQLIFWFQVRIVILQLDNMTLYYCRQVQRLFGTRFSQVSRLATSHAKTQVHVILVFGQLPSEPRMLDKKMVGGLEVDYT